MNWGSACGHRPGISAKEILGRIGREALWAPAAIVFVHWLAGAWFGHEPIVDPVMHFSGGLAAAFFFWRAGICARPYLGDPSHLALTLLSFGLAVTAAVGWEFAEFIGDRVRGTNMQRDLPNTMRDLFLGVGGALAYVGITVVGCLLAAMLAMQLARSVRA